ncbi:multidrug transporter subunit MdtD [Serratia sp. DD3]|uniref:multidrug transporter subunit MdtD n=1 Tax=Serratia sp. DD3 TaxID=1410619 RepID=UPI0003C4EC2D|nr:multidrug transporter subunit MdtD [Serratia sp. DD3]KEY56664.1 putative multidrug resistance protein MdtD [Serratia sp. DD3]
MNTKQPTSVKWQLWIVAFGFFMQALDTTIVNTALPSMAASLGENPLRMQSVVVSYVLTVAVMLPASGWLADRVGVKWVLFSAIILFTLGSLFCARAETLNELVMFRVIQGIGGAMMVPVGRLTVMKIVPRDQYMAAMTFVTIPGQIGPLMGPTLGGFLVQYASWHWIFLINIPVGIIGAIATLLFMPNYRMKTRRFDIGGFMMLAFGMSTLTLALDGHKGMGLSLTTIAMLVVGGCVALMSYWWHAKGNSRALFPLRLFKTPTYRIGLNSSLLARIGSGMIPFMTPLFLQVGMGFSPFHAGLMMIPMIIGSMGMKRIVVRVVNRLGYRHVLIATTLMLAFITLCLPLIAMLGWFYLLPVFLFCQGMVSALRFSAMNTLTLKDLPNRLASSGNSLLSMVMQLSMSLGVSISGILVGSFAHHQVVANSPEIHQAFIYSYGCMALIIALAALAFARVPADTTVNRQLNSRSTRTP